MSINIPYYYNDQWRQHSDTAASDMKKIKKTRILDFIHDQ